MSSLNGTNGFRINGVDEYDYSGVSVSDAGDVNGDGFHDLIIGADVAEPAGEAYVVFGKSSGFSAAIDLSTLDGTVVLGMPERVEADALNGFLPETFNQVIYMRDRPVLPDDARVLARDEGGAPAVFQIGNNAYGFLGNPGIKLGMVEDLIMEFEEVPAGAAEKLDELRALQVQIEDELVPIMTGLVQCTALMSSPKAAARVAAVDGGAPELVAAHRQQDRLRAMGLREAHELAHVLARVGRLQQPAQRQAVVADRGRRTQPLLEITRLEQVSNVVSVRRKS